MGNLLGAEPLATLAEQVGRAIAELEAVISLGLSALMLALDRCRNRGGRPSWTGGSAASQQGEG